MKIITISSHADNPGHLQLLRSLNHFGYDYHVIIMPFEFGRQMKTIYDWCKANWGWFCYLDAWDSFALGSPTELQEKVNSFPSVFKMIVSAEKACYPEARLKELYPPCETEWKYVNAGGFLTTCEFFIKMYDDGSHEKESNDQTWLSEQFLKRQDEIKLDYDCKIFQTIAFEGENDFGIAAGKLREPIRIINNKTRQQPIFFHGNGKTNIDKIYTLL